MTDEIRLAGELKKGSTSALERIIELYTGYVRTVCNNLSRGILPAQELDELVQDVFIRLWENRANLLEGALKPYLSAIARNAAKNRLRSMRFADDISEMDISSDIDIAQSAEISQALACLEEAISDLNAEDREIFLRFYFYGERTAAISAATSVPESTVRCKLTRTRQKLRKYMTERGFEIV